MLKDWTQGSSLTLRPTPTTAWRACPRPRGIKYVLIADDNTRLMQLPVRPGSTWPHLPLLSRPGRERQRGPGAGHLPSTQIYYLTVNTTKPPFDDVQVRQALYYALNKSELASAIAGEYGTLWPPLLPETQGDWCNTDPGDRVRPDTAK